MSKVCLATTVYNREKYITETINSVLNQTYKDFEYIIWDDGSTDKSVEIIKQLTKKDNRVRFYQGYHEGSGPALKKAFSKSNSEYLGCVDSDDLLAPTALEETVNILNSNSDLGLVYTDYIEIDSEGQILRSGFRNNHKYSKEYLLLNFMVFHFRLIRRSVYDQVKGIDKEFIFNHDYDLCLKLSEITKFQKLKKSLYYYRTHSDSISSCQKLDQLSYAFKAVSDALQRRGFSPLYKLELDDCNQFKIIRKQKEKDS